jgi:hypothetical protein
MNQNDADMLQIALGSSECFNEDAPTPANPNPFRDRQLLDSLLHSSPENSNSNITNWHSAPNRAVIEFYICRPGSKPPQSCIEGETILSKVFRNIRDVVFSNEFYISALKEANKEISNLYPFWQLIQASVGYSLMIIGIGYVREGASDPLQSYHTMDFPMTPKAIQQAPRPAHIQDYATFPPKVELAVYLYFAVQNPNQSRTHKMADTPPITIKPKPGTVFVEAPSSQTHESKLSGQMTHKTLMAPPLPRLPADIKTERPDDDKITILSSNIESESERRRRKKEKAKRQREKMLSYVLEHLEKRQPDLNPPVHVAPRIKPPP